MGDSLNYSGKKPNTNRIDDKSPTFLIRPDGILDVNHAESIITLPKK